MCAVKSGQDGCFYSAGALVHSVDLDATSPVHPVGPSSKLEQRNFNFLLLLKRFQCVFFSLAISWKKAQQFDKESFDLIYFPKNVLN